MPTPGSGQPTVLVKKADGTAVRMTLDELAAQKKGKGKEMTYALATATPVKNIFIDEAKAWDKEDHASLLETAAHEVSAIPHIPVSPEIDGRVQQVLGACKECVPKALLGRFESLLLSRLKGIRTDDQLTEYFSLSEKEGGLGMRQEDIGQILEAIRNVYHLAPPVPAPAPAPRRAEKQKPSVPVVPAPRPPAAAKFGKPVLHDVVPAPAPATLQTKRTMGPVEELGAFTIIELRRIGVSGEALVRELLEKFDTLRKESYLLYLDGRDAWYRSPLYARYLERTIESINKRIPLPDVFSRDDSPDGPMSMDEYTALVRLHHAIEI